MPSRFVLGPAIQVSEPAAAPPAQPPSQDAQIEIVGTQPGGRVTINLLPHDTTVNHPLNVYAFYVNPPSKVPAADQLTPDWFFSSGAPVGSVATKNLGPGRFDILVANVQPGANHVQTILEFAA